MNKRKNYVVYEDTLENISKLTNTSGAYYSSITLYKHRIDRSNLSPEQQEIQARGNWYREQRSNVRFTEDTLMKLIDKIAYEKVLGGCTENIYDVVYKEVMNTNFRSIAEVEEYEDDGEKKYRVFAREEVEPEEGEYTNDLNELEKVLETIKNETYSKDVIYLEEFEVYAYQYEVEKLPETVGKLIKKFIRENLTYCLLKNKVIVPQEYLDKGKEGIVEWREIKASNNKNNSMEKKMLKETYKQQKTYAYNVIEQIMWGAVKDGMNWSLPCLEIEGRFNRTKSSKLANQLLEGKSKQEIMLMKDEEFIQLFKDYWKDKLQEAIEAIDKFEVDVKKV